MAEVHLDNFKLRQNERADFKVRGPLIGGILAANLSHTSLVEEKPFAKEDIHKSRSALLQAAPFAHPKVFPSYWEHVVYSSILARYIAESVGSDELKPLEAECLQLMGDDGSIIIPHRYFRKNVVSELVDKRISIRPDPRKKQPPIPEILGRRKPVQDVSNLTLPQVILDLADNLGKLNDDGTPFSIQQMKRYDESQAKRYIGGVFASERFGLRALTQTGKQKLAIDLVFAEIELLQTKYALNTEEVCTATFAEFSNPENQTYLRSLKQAPETLDPAVDKALGKPLMQTVVFDIGGVLTNLADNALWQAMALQLNHSAEEVSKAISESLDDGLPGKISKEAYLKRFFAALGLAFPASMEEAEGYFNQPEVYYPTPGMPELIGKILGNPSVQVFLLSDAIPPLVKPNLDAVERFYPGIQTDNVLFSSTIGAAKREKGSPALKLLLDQLGNPDPQTVLFIDDNATYATNFRSLYGGRAMHFRENDPERLIQELKLAKIA